MSPPPPPVISPYDGSEFDRAGLAAVVADAFTLDRWVREPLLEGQTLAPMFAAGALEAAERARTTPARAFCLLARAPELVVGSVLGHLEDGVEEFTGVKVGTIWSLAVAPDRRRQGVGRLLFAAARAWMVERGCRQLNVSTDAGNPAGELYLAAGCRPVHTLHTYALDLPEGGEVGSP
jgi:GNAT superfamily N-acetyltransferase